jgi:MacB-like periplasmic core domain/FtsX-like permease family
MLNDLRFAFRLLLKNPAFTAVAIVAIALGIGANTAVLSLVNALLIRPLPYRAPGRIVLMLEHFRAQHLDAIPVSAPEFIDYQTSCRGFEKMAVFQPARFNFAGGDRPERIFGAVGSADLFNVLGVAPIRGRAFEPADCTAGHDDVLIISERLWKRQFRLLGLFAAIALALASIGIYGVMSFLVVQRTHELGVRMALGAQRRDILRLVVGHAAKLILTGTFIGLAFAFATTHLLAAMLYHVSPHDLSTFVFVTVVLGAIALVASYIPTSRVIRTDPTLALTHTA